MTPAHEVRVKFKQPGPRQSRTRPKCHADCAPVQPAHQRNRPVARPFKFINHQLSQTVGLTRLCQLDGQFKQAGLNLVQSCSDSKIVQPRSIWGGMSQFAPRHRTGLLAQLAPFGSVGFISKAPLDQPLERIFTVKETRHLMRDAGCAWRTRNQAVKRGPEQVGMIDILHGHLLHEETYRCAMRQIRTGPTALIFQPLAGRYSCHIRLRCPLHCPIT